MRRPPARHGHKDGMLSCSELSKYFNHEDEGVGVNAKMVEALGKEKADEVYKKLAEDPALDDTVFADDKVSKEEWMALCKA